MRNIFLNDKVFVEGDWNNIWRAHASSN